MLRKHSGFQFAVVEVVVTSIQDGFPKWVKRHLLCHEVLVLLICVVSFLFGLPNITQVGSSTLNRFDLFTELETRCLLS